MSNLSSYIGRLNHVVKNLHNLYLNMSPIDYLHLVFVRTSFYNNLRFGSSEQRNHLVHNLSMRYQPTLSGIFFLTAQWACVDTCLPVSISRSYNTSNITNSCWIGNSEIIYNKVFHCVSSKWLVSYNHISIYVFKFWVYPHLGTDGKQIQEIHFTCQSKCYRR